MAKVNAIIITIGDELLIGQTIDTNSAWMAQQLNKQGIDVIKRIAIGDIKKDIIDSLDQSINEADVIFVTGGLGPTSDDITKPVLCEYFNGKLKVNKDVLSQIRSIFEKRKLPILDVVLKQAEVPDNCMVLLNKKGSAPGMLFEKDKKIIISLPGVPHEMMTIMEDEVMPRLQETFSSDAIYHASIITAGKGESYISEKINDIEEALPAHIKLAYLPGHWVVKLRLTGKDGDGIFLQKEVDQWQKKIAQRLDDIVIALEDIELEEIAGKSLIRHQKKIGLAESCTGGYIAHKFTQVTGSSNYFNGSIVCYQNNVKEQLLKVEAKLMTEKGVISEDVAIQMAKGAMSVLGSDMGFGITGLLGAGGEENRVPIGTVWMCVCDGKDIKTKEFHFPYDRLRNKEVAANMALLLIWKFLKQQYE